ncbi:serine protease persephone-like isoform X1 [Euwallacea similis]|uniref:serine protease persephone-like isoform X1 n=1 Tax=Euwallacea similis TaxID=1736056 RepID=UPI00344C5133
MLKIVVIVYVLGYTLVCGNYYEAKEEGSQCQRRGLPGICKRVRHCPIAIESLRKRGQHDLLRCGFVGNEEVVCCPDLSDRQPLPVESSTIDKSTVWSEEHEHSNESGGDKNGTTNEGRITKKRKSELMCNEMYKKIKVTSGVQFHILNGEDAEVGQFPHMVALGITNDDGQIDWGRCGASLISPKFLLSAAHCFICLGCSVESLKKARFGVIDNTDDSKAQDVDVKGVTFTGSYDITSNHNDIALIELVWEVNMSQTVFPACLYTEADDPLGLIVTGWGRTDATDITSRSKILQYGKIMPVSTDKCNTSILSKNANTRKVILQTQICAISNLSVNRTDACMGDSGGPLQLERKTGGYDIVGIVSYGFECGTSVPGVYTRVSAYLDWIEQHVWPS